MRSIPCSIRPVKRYILGNNAPFAVRKLPFDPKHAAGPRASRGTAEGSKPRHPQISPELFDHEYVPINAMCD